MITHLCTECGQEVEDSCQEHPRAMVISVLSSDQGAIPDAEIFDDDTTRIVVHAQAAMQPSEYKNGG